ncbi:MAG: serine/threonine protein kinase [Ruminococcus sp.]|nr:serine/threonine protein kinase [Ruminococcus sp.]MCM1381599.1 serine/threonine protein kinase [Muribaculaceae bacterium]MCM1479798.1 serine/threonine protein kinase [Muribaculaceae bacterium]
MGNCFETDALPQGTALSDRYVAGRVIGSGGFGITYLAYDTVEEKKVAVKEYYPKGVAVRSPDGFTVEPLTAVHMPDFTAGRERFEKEAQILSRLGGSTDVIQVYDAFEQNGTAYYAMEYVNGITVREYTKKYGKASEGQVLFAALEIVPAFKRIHEKNIIHRDLSPNNIMIDGSGGVKLVDFGNARPFTFDGGNSMTVALKPGYAPIEQYQHHGEHGPWTDIYSLGAVMYHMLTLNDPDDPMTRFNDDSGFREGLSRIDEKFSRIINKMSALKIEERYTESGELLSDLRRLNIAPRRLVN